MKSISTVLTAAISAAPNGCSIVFLASDGKELIHAKKRVGLADPECHAADGRHDEDISEEEWWHLQEAVRSVVYKAELPDSAHAEAAFEYFSDTLDGQNKAWKYCAGDMSVANTDAHKVIAELAIKLAAARRDFINQMTDEEINSLDEQANSRLRGAAKGLSESVRVGKRPNFWE